MRNDEKPLSGRHILVVEDEYLIADDLARMLTDLGAAVVGPAATLAQAKALIAGAQVDCAILDINLDGEMAFPVAEELAKRRVPVVIASGYGSDILKPRVNATLILEKPCSQERLAAAIMSTIADAAQVRA